MCLLVDEPHKLPAILVLLDQIGFVPFELSLAIGQVDQSRA
jgi:hypothetical protein